MQTLPNPGDLVLVAFLPQPKDLEIARVLGWYRVPWRSTSRQVLARIINGALSGRPQCAATN
jgi:hypothetical protein